MSPLQIVIEVYGGVVQNVYVARDAPETLLEAVIVDWDFEHYDAAEDRLVHATGLDGEPMRACVCAAALKPWRGLPTAGLREVLDRAGLADYGLPGAGEPQAAARRGAEQRDILLRSPRRAT